VADARPMLSYYCLMVVCKDFFLLTMMQLTGLNKWRKYSQNEIKTASGI